MSRENYIDTDKLIETIGQGEVKFFLESQSVELELKVAIRKGETNDSTVYVLGSFEGAGLDGLHTLKVKIGDGSGTTQDGSTPPKTPTAKPSDGNSGESGDDPGSPSGGSGKPQPPPPEGSGEQSGGEGGQGGGSGG